MGPLPPHHFPMRSLGGRCAAEALKTTQLSNTEVLELRVRGAETEFTVGTAGHQHHEMPALRNFWFLSSASWVIFREELKEVLSPSLTWDGSQDGCVFGRKQKPRSEETAHKKGYQRRAKGVKGSSSAIPLSIPKATPHPHPRKPEPIPKGRQASGWRLEFRPVFNDKKSKVP